MIEFIKGSEGINLKNIKVKIHNKTTLELLEDANKGDIIDLESIETVDTSLILDKISNATDRVYQAKLSEALDNERLRLENENNLKLKELESANLLLRNEMKTLEQSVKSELENRYQLQINNLNNQLEKEALQRENMLKELKHEHKDVVTELNRRISDYDKNKQISDLNLTNEYERQKNELKESLTEKINELTKDNEDLRRNRSNLTVKNIGESLETWCDNEFNRNNLVMPSNITWEKDNEVVSGSKADFLYKVYANDNLEEDELLTSAILEMKSEDPNATFKQNMQKIYKTLDTDRNNKKIEYAILVSEIDRKENNDVPIKKVPGYDKMFEVRPEYFVTLLNIITAFGLKYKEILLADKEERIKFSDTEDILEEFEQMKNEILDLSLKYINNQVEEIVKQAENIRSANDKILVAADIILNTHLQTVRNKLDSFKINKITKSINDLEGGK